MMEQNLLQDWDNTEVDKEMQLKLDKLADWRTLEENHFIHQVEKARTGTNVGLGNGLKGPTKYTYGTHKGRYYLIGADSGVGKTTVSDFMYLYKAYESAKRTGRKLYVFYYSFEISLEEKKARWVSYFMYLRYGISIPADYIQGRIPGMMVTDAHMQMIRMSYIMVEEMMSYCNMVVIEDPVHPTRIFHDLTDHHFDKIGKVLRHTPHDPKKRGAIRGWQPNPGEENSITIKIMDHLALLANEQGFDTKQTIDLHSKYDVTLRNLFGLTCVNIQQFNTDITSTYRMKGKGDAVIVPQRIDFGDSRYTFRDANVVYGLIKPSIYDMEQYYKYNVDRLGPYFIGMHLMKNRHGSSQRMLPIFLNGIAGVAEDLPLTPTIDITMDEYYLKANKLEEVVQHFTPKE